MAHVRQIWMLRGVMGLTDEQGWLMPTLLVGFQVAELGRVGSVYMAVGE